MFTAIYRIIALVICRLFERRGQSRIYFVRPPYLKTGDWVGIISPVAKVSATLDTSKVHDRFKEWGLRVEAHLFLIRVSLVSGTDEEIGEYMYHIERML